MLIYLFTACQEVVEVDLKETSAKLVIDGLVTDQPGPYYVKLSTTGNFYSTEPAPTIADAVVTIADDAGNSETLTQEFEPGSYQTNLLQGVVGRTYYLTVQHNGQTYQSEAYLPPVTDIDSLKPKFVKESVTKDEGYYLYFYAKEPRGEANYYRFLIYENDSLYNSKEDILIANDEFVKGYINGLELDYPFDLGDKVRLEMYSLTKPAYDYYNGLINVYGNDGGLFSPPPANPPTTISNGALGIFRASSFKSAEVIITGEE